MRKGESNCPPPTAGTFEQHYGTEFYVTSLTGEYARLYPMPEWLNIEEKLQTRGTMDSAVRKFLDFTNYFGQLAEMDSQGRLLVHPLLRSSAQLMGDVTVLGYLQYLEVWELDRFKARMAADPYTAEDAASLALLGI